MKIGRRLRGHEAIELIGDLGAGKTAFVRGLASGIDSRDQVTSPSFTISNVYSAEKLQLHHFDFYRLDDPGIMTRELAEALEDPRSSVVVEWAGPVKDVLPSEHMTVRITVTGDSERRFEFLYPDSMEYLLTEAARA